MKKNKSASEFIISDADVSAPAPTEMILDLVGTPLLMMVMSLRSELDPEGESILLSRENTLKLYNYLGKILNKTI